MAGDWLKIEKHTPEKPEIAALAAIHGMDPEIVFAKCFKVWAWADSMMTDGTVRRVDPSFLDALVHARGFAHALIEVGWLQVRDGGDPPQSRSLVIPNFARHMGQSAKQRALTANRVSAHRRRKTKRGCNGESVNSSSLLFSQDGGIENDAAGGRAPPRGFVAPTVDEVRAYCAERGNNVDPEQFVDHYTANGWVQGNRGKPLKDWRAAVRTWEKHAFQGNGSLRPGVYDGLKEFAARAAADGTLHKEHGT